MAGPDGRIRVLWLAKGLGQGGMERLLVTHAQLGDRDRFDYRVGYLVERPHSVIDELRHLDVPVERFGTGGADPRWVPQVVRYARRERIDVVHTHSPMVAAAVRPALALGAPEVRRIHTEHNRWDRYALPTRWANRLTYPLDHLSYAVSDDCRSTVAPRLRRRVTTLIHGIDVDAVAAHRSDRADARRELGVDDDTVVVGTVANLRKQKNYPLLLEVAARVTERHPDAVFVSVGQGPLEDELTALHAQLGLGDRFRFLGFRADVHRVMSAFDVFCLSSDHEGLPVALMEAKALGLPVVATAVGGIPSAVEDGEDGVLVPRRSTEGLTNAVLSLVGSPRRLDQIAERSRVSAGRFGASVAVDALEDQYVSRWKKLKVGP